MLVGKFSNGTHAGLIRLNACLHKYLPAIIIPTVVAQWELIFCHSLGLVDTIRKMRLIYIHINGINLLFTFISFLYLLCIRYLLNSVTILYLYMYVHISMHVSETYILRSDPAYLSSSCLPRVVSVRSVWSDTIFSQLFLFVDYYLQSTIKVLIVQINPMQFFLVFPRALVACRPDPFTYDFTSPLS